VSSIVCRQVTATYGDRVALDSIDLEVGPGEWLGVIGPNGAGKSTLIRVLAGLMPTQGSTLVDGRPIADLPRREVARLVAVVPQQPVLPDAMPVLDYVLLGRTPHISYWGMEGANDLRITNEILSRLDLAGFEDRPLGELSGGERQRTVLARALAQEPDILLLDEPTAALDLGHQQQVLDLVDGLRRERSMSVVSALHDLTLAGLYADRLVLLDHGVVRASGLPSEVLTGPHLTRYYAADIRVLVTDDGEIVIAPRRAGRAAGPAD
jgi:iron complex transport system ATP-binding protein